MFVWNREVILEIGDIFLKIALKLRQKCAKVEIQKSKQIVNCQI